MRGRASGPGFSVDRTCQPVAYRGCIVTDRSSNPCTNRFANRIASEGNDGIACISFTRNRLKLSPAPDAPVVSGN